MKSFVNLSLTSRNVQGLIKDSSIWKWMCGLLYEFSPFELSLELPKFDSWFEMFKLKPFLRKDGIYISKVTYIRPGLSAESYHQPFHLVTYYRYLRFLENGFVNVLTSSSAPGSVIPNLVHSNGQILAEWVCNINN
jgi:F-box protein 9